MTQQIQYNEEMVGAGHPTKTDTLNRLINLITAANEILYGTGAATMAALSVAEQRIVGRKTGGNITGLTAAEVLTILGISAGGGGSVRQTVLSSSLSSGLPNFISIGTGRSVNIAATTTPIRISF